MVTLGGWCGGGVVGVGWWVVGVGVVVVVDGGGGGGVVVGVGVGVGALGGGTCYVSVPLQRVTFELRYFSSEDLSQGYIFDENPIKIGILGLNLRLFLEKFLLKWEYLGWNSLKSYENGIMIRKFSLAKGMFSTKISLTKGVRSKTGAAQHRQKHFGVPLSPTGWPCPLTHTSITRTQYVNSPPH